MRQNQLNWLDRAIGWIAPRALYGRLAWRSAALGYDAAGRDRLNDGWNPVINQPATVVDRGSRDMLRARSRDLERNTDMSESIIRARVRNIVGTGFTLQAQIKDKDGNDLDDVNTAVEEFWRDFCRARNCDITGRQSLSRMLRMAVRRMCVDGGVFFIKSYTSGGIVPLVLQMREVDELDSLFNGTTLKNGNYIVDGIEVDQYGKHVAYYFKAFTPDGYSQVDPVRIEADRVIYLQYLTRPSQVREITPMAPSLSRIRDTNQYIEAISVQARIAACLALIIKKITPTGLSNMGRSSASGKVDAGSGYAGQTMTPGMVVNLQPGEDASTVTPPPVGSSAKDMLVIQQRLAASAQGLSYEVASRDMSQVNYSSARQGLLEDQTEYRCEQQYIVEELLDEVYTSALISAALTGRLPFTVNELLAEKGRYMKHVFIPAGWSWIDPVREVRANELALNSCQTTLAQICAGAGQDWRDVVKQRGREMEAMAAAGIPISAIGGKASGQGTESAAAEA